MTAIGAFAADSIDDSLRDITVDVPQLRPRDVLVRVHAVSVNPVDVKQRTALEPSAEPKVLGYDAAPLSETDGTWSACVDPTGAGPRLYFQRVPEGKVVKNRVHLDVRVGTGLVGEERLSALQAEARRLVALGASVVEVLEADEENESCIVMQDVEGNELCLD